MTAVNQVILAGNLTKDPELKTIPSGKTVAEMRLAITERFKSGSGENVEKTCYIDIETWDRQAENCGKYLKKGSPILVEGKLQMDEWEDKEGNKRSRIRVRARNIQFLSTRRGDAAPAGKTGADTDAGPQDVGAEETPF